ncbi:MAG: hypothetical protein ACREUM_02225 [Nitrosospira sp.]
MAIVQQRDCNRLIARTSGNVDPGMWNEPHGPGLGVTRAGM